MSISPLAQELNTVIKQGNPHLLAMLSRVGKRLFFPKGILSQSAEAKEKADPEFNATIGIATENSATMYLPSVMSYINQEKITPGECLTYAPSFGLPDLRKAWRAALFEKNPSLAGKSISLPVVTQGITHGISVFADMFIDPETPVLFPDKMWGNNLLIMSVRRDARIVQYRMFDDRNRFDLKSFEEAATREAASSDKIIVVLNFPNNPTGYSLYPDEGEAVVDILKRVADAGTNVIAIMDDAYFGLCYEEGPMRESLFAALCDAHPGILAIKLDGATKEMFVFGLRVGFITYGIPAQHGRPEVIYDAMEKKTAGNVRGSISNVSHLSQRLVLNCISSEMAKQENAQKVRILKSRAHRVKAVSADERFRKAWDVYPFNSGYFMCLRLKTVQAEPLRRHLLDTYRTGLIATGERDVRIAFSSVDEENIPELFEKIHRGILDLEKESQTAR